MTSEPKLEQPGAGLPLLEWAFANYILFPTLFRFRSTKTALSLVDERCTEIYNTAASVPAQQASIRILVPRLTGIEDSSRYWSIAMVLDHLVIVTDLMRQVIIGLTTGSTLPAPVGTADVKPRPDVSAAEALSAFAHMHKRFVQEIGECDFQTNKTATFPHPWFGPLTAHQWLVFVEPHMSIHYKQIKEIIKRLDG